MRYYFTANNLIGSKIIQWGLNDDCSHFAVGFDEDRLGEYAPILEARLGGGFQIKWLKDFLSHNKVIHCLKPKRELGEREDRIYLKTCERLHGKKYDPNGVLFWAGIAIGYRCGIISKDEMDGFNNRWANKASIYCVEVLNAHKDFLVKHGFKGEYLDRQNLRPCLAYKLLLDTGLFEGVIL